MLLPQTQKTIDKLEKKIARLKKDKRLLEEENVEQRKDITKMIRIFLLNEHLWPDEQKEEFRAIAIEWATRIDEQTGARYCMNQINFRPK
jgi:septal ring factor EnvC (AmiA/AmiB activator)